MKSLKGNNLLIIDMDTVFAKQLSDNLTIKGGQCLLCTNIAEAHEHFAKYDFDLVVCSYYLPDGIIHQLIDWCKNNLVNLPVFVVLGQALPSEDGILHQHLITNVVNRNDSPSTIVDCISGLLFDYEGFKLSVKDLLEPKGVEVELMVHMKKYKLKPLELISDGLYYSADENIENGSFAILRVSLYEGAAVYNHVFTGSTGVNYKIGGSHFKVNPVHLAAWGDLLARLEKKQIKITEFLEKVSGR